MFETDNKDIPERVIASYVYNITKFVSWPQRVFNFSVSPFIVGIYQSKNFGSHLAITLREKKIQDRDWKVEVFNSPPEIRNCHLIFFIDTPIEKTEPVIDFIRKKPILTIAYNIENFCNSGGMINITGEIPNLGFEINKHAFEQANLDINSELLNLATIV